MLPWWAASRMSDIRFFTDEDVYGDLAAILRTHGFFVSLMESFLVHARGKLDADAADVIRDTVAKFKSLPAVAPGSISAASNAKTPRPSQVPSGYSIAGKTAPPDVDRFGAHHW